MENTLKIFGTHDDQTVEQMYRCMAVGSVSGAVLCADGHLGYAQPVGGVVAYEKHVSISGVGFDIGCGNMAIKLDAQYDRWIKGQEQRIIRDISRKVTFGVGRANNVEVEHELFDDLSAWAAADTNNYKEMARSQLGTVGSGNHYVDIFRDEEGYAWVGVHFGSRGLGHKSATKYLKLADGKDGINVAPAIVDPETELGERYLAAMELAGRYAYAGREWVCDQVRRIIGARVIDTIHNHHNFAWKETHDGKEYWVVRKGATPAFPGQRGFVGGSMGDNAVIIKGVESPESKASLYSTIHGAGRLYGRRAAKQAFTRAAMDKWLADKGVFLQGGDLDESPMAYRRLDDVLKFHEGTIEIEHVLTPKIVMMAGRNEFDPYKD
jgi:tRNA-splicing ligase RtcB